MFEDDDVAMKKVVDSENEDSLFSLLDVSESFLSWENKETLS